ncbi:MAG: Rrf2 family transcriptional regulator [Acidimicrobiia bacterium]|nr:Rrf2 family transcriptional regulator [Acidimicrobiia bacterium]
MRLDITRKSDLAVRALCVLGSQVTRLKGSDLAELIETTPGFLPQVVAPLVRRRWIDSTPGPTGGYLLGVQLDDISLLDVIEAVEGPLDLEVCVLDGGHCTETNHCAVHGAWMRARHHLYEELATTPISRSSPRREP